MRSNEEDLKSEPPSVWSVKSLDPWDKHSLIGGGAMGAVYRTKFEGREVAVKVIPAWRFAEEEKLQMFVNEAKLLCMCNHKNVVKVVGFDQEEMVLCLGMPTTFLFPLLPLLPPSSFFLLFLLLPASSFLRPPFLPLTLPRIRIYFFGLLREVLHGYTPETNSGGFRTERTQGHCTWNGARA
jgi:serine/threonine protein kinase